MSTITTYDSWIVIYYSANLYRLIKICFLITAVYNLFKTFNNAEFVQLALNVNVNLDHVITEPSTCQVTHKKFTQNGLSVV